MSLSIKRQSQLVKVRKQVATHLVSASFSFLRRPRTFFVRFFSPDTNTGDVRTHLAQLCVKNTIVCVANNKQGRGRAKLRDKLVELNEENHPRWQWANKNKGIDPGLKHPAFFSWLSNLLNLPWVSLHSLRKMERKRKLRLINVSTWLATFWGGVERELLQQAVGQTGCRDPLNTTHRHWGSSRQNQRKATSRCVFGIWDLSVNHDRLSWTISEL